MMTGKKALKDKNFNELMDEANGTSSPKKVFDVMRTVSLDNTMTLPERETFFGKVIRTAKSTIDKAARKITPGTHEFINTSSTTNFGMRTALGLTAMQRTAEGADGSPKTFDNVITKFRIPTAEYVCRPVKIKDLKPKQQAYFPAANPEQYVFQGHTACATAGPDRKDFVTADGASRSGFHKEQLDAQAHSKTHVGLINKVSKIADKYQMKGEQVINAYNNGGFHPQSFWGNRKVTTKEEAVAVAIDAEFFVKKRQTEKRHLTNEYKKPIDLSEEYSDIDTNSEVDSDDYDAFKTKYANREPYRSMLGPK